MASHEQSISELCQAAYKLNKLFLNFDANYEEKGFVDFI